MRHIVLSLFALGALSCGFARETVALSSAGSPLRLSRVVVYQNGLAHFERRGRADSSTVELRVPASQVDDVLRSLTVVDGGQAAITGVRLLPSEPNEDATLRIGLASEGARDLRITYVTEAPGWRPTYRVVVSDDGQVHLQGLAVVDNPTSEPWQDVALTLSTDVPLSFRFDLREARNAERPHFGADGRLLRTDEQAQLALVNPLANADNNNVNMAYGLAQRGQPQVSSRAGQLIGNPEVPAPSAPASGNASGNALLAFEERPEAEGRDFSSVEGFDLGGHESGLVPFVDTSTAGELALLFKPSPGGALSQAHPYRAVLFRNPTESSLSTGPVAIYAGERFVGDGVTGSIPARAHAFVPYAIERSIDVRQSTEQTEDEVRATALAGGVLTVELRAVHRARFVVETSSRPEARLFVFAARAEGFEPRQLPRGTIETRQGFFLPVALDEQGHAEVSFDQLRRTVSHVNVASSPEHGYVPALLALLAESEDVARLRAIADRLVAIDHELVSVNEDLEVERGALSERREALDALRGVQSAGGVRAQLGRAVAQGVTRVDALTRRATELHAEEIAIEQEWYGRLRALTISASAGTEG